MRLKKNIFFFIAAIFILYSCFFTNKNESINRSVIIKLVYKLDNKQSLYWFNDAGLITSEGISYFQIADNVCDLDFEKANAECWQPLGILKQQNDSVFIVSQDSVIQKIKNDHYKIVQTDYDFRLRTSITTADHRKAFFLSDKCGNKK